MSQNSITLPTTGTVSGLQQTQNANNALDTLNTLWSGASAPSSPEAGQLWHDTTNNILKIRSLDNSSWISLLTLDEVNYTTSPPMPRLPSWLSTATSDSVGVGQCVSTTQATVFLRYSGELRSAVSGITVSSAGHLSVLTASGSTAVCTAVVLNTTSRYGIELLVTIATASLVAGNATILRFNNASGSITTSGGAL